MATTEAPPARLWLSPDDVAALYDVSPITVRDWINVGVPYTKPTGHRARALLKAKKVGRRWKIHPDDLAAFISTTTGDDAKSFPPVASETEAERQKRIDACQRRLAERLGA